MVYVCKCTGVANACDTPWLATHARMNEHCALCTVHCAQSYYYLGVQLGHGEHEGHHCH